MKKKKVDICEALKLGTIVTYFFKLDEFLIIKNSIYYTSAVSPIDLIKVSRGNFTAYEYLAKD